MGNSLIEVDDKLLYYHGHESKKQSGVGWENNFLQRSIIMLTTLGAKVVCSKGCENNWSADRMGVFTTIVPQFYELNTFH